MAGSDGAVAAEDDALYVLTAVLLTPAKFPSVLGDDYPEACAALGLVPIVDGYGLVFGQDAQGARWTVVVDDVSLVAVAIASWDCGMEYDLSPDDRTVVAALGGWPLAVAVSAPGVPAPHDPEPDPEDPDRLTLSPPDTTTWGPAQRRLGADEIALQWAMWRAQIDDSTFATGGGPTAADASSGAEASDPAGGSGEADASEASDETSQDASDEASGAASDAASDEASDAVESAGAATADEAEDAPGDEGSAADGDTDAAAAASDADGRAAGDSKPGSEAQEGSATQDGAGSDTSSDATTDADAEPGTEPDSTPEPAPTAGAAPDSESGEGPEGEATEAEAEAEADPASPGPRQAVRRVLAEARAYIDTPPPLGRVRSAFATGEARTLRADGPGWSMVARTDDIAFVLLDEEPGEVLPVGRGPELPGLLAALDKMAVRPS